MLTQPCNPERRSTALLAVAALLTAAPSARAGTYAADKIELKSQIPLSGFDTNPSAGNDCWGYVSPSGREYALMGVRNAMVVVEITDPVNPVIVDDVPHTNCVWGDMKTYGDHCYVVNDCSGGMDIVDLSGVDSGTVTLIGQMTGLVFRSHNVAIDTDSGFLYLCGANLGGGRLIAVDLSVPDNPVQVGSVSAGAGVYVHDARIVTYSSGPYSGKQIAFCAVGGAGLDVYDVTDKSNMFRLSRTTYTNLAYAHQVWLSDDKQYLYLNDEGDNINETVIFDISDLASPVVVNTYHSGTPTAYDHNLYLKDGYVFEADYTAGMRVFCALDPVNPVQVGWFDTHPENDAPGFDGLWSVFPFFPSGTVIASDSDRGLFVFDVSEAISAGALAFEFPQGRPAHLFSLGGATIRVDVTGACGGVHAAGTGMLHYDDGGGFVSVPMVEVSSGAYDAVFPALECASNVKYYVTAETAGGSIHVDPLGAPLNTYEATALVSLQTVLEDTFETDLGWTVADFATDGLWERGVPVDDPNYDWDPSTDADGSGQCYLTSNVLGESDVDQGFVFLMSPLLDMSAGNIGFSYEYYVRLSNANGFDGIRVEISSGGGAGPWTEVTRHVVDGGPGWNHYEATAADLADLAVVMTSTMMVRFTAGDGAPESIVEAGIDGFKLNELVCELTLGDIDGDGTVGVSDLLIMLGAWGACPDPCPPSCPSDLDGDCMVGVTDLLVLLGNWG